MKTFKRTCKGAVLMMLAVLWTMAMTVYADYASGDNSLYSLGLENGECSPEFYYSTLEYDVTVPAGTTELYLSPITSDENAEIIDISGTVLDDNGNGTVYITVQAPNGAQVSYVLNVSSDGQAASNGESESETETELSEEAKREEELRKQAESEEAARKELELQAKAEKADKLQTELDTQTDKLNLLIKILYGLVGLAVLLLFFIINQSLRNKDLKDELKEARTEADLNTEFARRSDNMRSDYYYAPVHTPQQNMAQPVMDASANVQAAFGNASQRLQANSPQQAAQPGQELSRKEQKKLEKAAKKAAKEQRNKAGETPQQQVYQMPQITPQAAPATPTQPATPAEPMLVQGSEQEPDVSVEMIDL